MRCEKHGIEMIDVTAFGVTSAQCPVCKAESIAQPFFISRACTIQDAGKIKDYDRLESENAALKVERDEAEQALSDMAGKFALLAAENAQQAKALKAEIEALKKPVEGVDAIESELETRKIACPKMVICDSCNQADICPNLIARKQLASLTARLKEAEEIINDAYYHGDRMNITRAGEYLRALEQARKVGT